ncbi:MAG: transposase [Acidobacteriota bacterium]|nr:transposase [Acidobacteriota bacterium]
MESIKLLARNGEAVRHALELGEILHMETASEELTDEFLIFAIKSGLLKSWAEGFPDPRQWSEISIEVILAASIAARFARLYSLRKTGYVLRSARVLGELGYSVEVTQAGDGLSSRGTQDESLMSGDSIRKLLVKMEQRVEVDAPALTHVEAAPMTAPVQFGARRSRRAVKQVVNEAEAEVRARVVAAQLVAWYNRSVGLPMLEYARLGSGRRLHILDATPIEVALETATYECSGVVKNEDGSSSRGYKLATLRTLLDTAGVLTQVQIGSLQTHDMELCRELLSTSQALRRGDLVLEDRGFLDGATLTHLKAQRGVDVIVPLKSNMHAYREAVAIAAMDAVWQPHPSRPAQQIAFVKGVEHVWAECGVPLNACVIRFYNKRKQATDDIVLVTTDSTLTAEWIVRHYEERPEIEQDYQQLKSGGWQLQKLSTTRYSEIVFYILSVVTSYSLYQLFSNTHAGSRFAGQTRAAIEMEQLKTRRTHIIVYAGGYFELFETFSFVRLVLGLTTPVQERLRSWLDEHLGSVKHQE